MDDAAAALQVAREALARASPEVALRVAQAVACCARSGDVDLRVRALLLEAERQRALAEPAAAEALAREAVVLASGSEVEPEARAALALAIVRGGRPDDPDVVAGLSTPGHALVTGARMAPARARPSGGGARRVPGARRGRGPAGARFRGRG